MLRSKLILAFFLISFAAQSQVNRYFVFFKDKTGTPFTLSNPTQFLSSKSIERRQKQNINLIEEDLPVNPTYVSQVKSTGAKTFFPSKWFNGVLIEATASTLTSVNALPFVSRTEFVAPGSKLLGGRVSKIKKQKNSSADQPVNKSQLQQIGIDKMHGAGYRGEGISIAIFDSGYTGVNITSPFAELFTENRVKQTFNFVTNTASVYSSDDHGTEVLSVMAAHSSTYTGGVYKANYFLYLTEDISSEYRIEEYNWTFAAERADSAGVDVINSSLGYNTEFDDPIMDYQLSDLDGKTAIITKAARKAIEKGMVVVCSAGNEGNNSWKLVTPPADAVGILAIGSINSVGSLSSFSSKGPTADGRIKPDVVALGSGTSVIKQSGSLGTASGTSLASPLVASLAAGVWQAYPILSAHDVYEAIVLSATLAASPNNQFGFGIPHFQAIENYLKSLSENQEIAIFPNPVSGDSFKIKVKEPTDELVQVAIYDTRGSRVAESQVKINWLNNPFEYDISLLKPGIYFVQVTSGKASTTARIAKL
ncbi:MAG: S8 family peptidase [Cyclobacteriaceae bacterium]|nr:S8 family peptidase [Cyclobacteriaceae bacterium]